MRVHARISLLALLVCAVAVAAVIPAAAQAEALSVEKFVAINCNAEPASEKCAETPGGENPVNPGVKSGEPKPPSKEEAEHEGFTQAAGHVPFGITDFKVLTVEESNHAISPGTFPNQLPTGIITHIRTDVPAGLATAPVATPQCTEEQFGTEALPKSGLYLESKCPESTKVGINEATVYAGSTAKDVPVAGNVYNLVQSKGVALEFGIALKLPKPLTEASLFEIFKGSQPGIEKAQYYAHTIIDGNVEWGKQSEGTGAGDYHDYFTIEVSPKLPLIRSRLIFYGTSGEGENGYLITNGTNCNSTLTSRLLLQDGEAHTVAPGYYTPPIGLTGCDKVPFEPTLALNPSTTQSDAPDGIVANVGLTPHHKKTDVDTAHLKTLEAKLPEGMTLNPSAAAGLEACTPAQARIHSEAKGTSCPGGSKIGTVELDVPQLPNGSLTGNVYLGGPESGPITGAPYTVYVDAESERYGVSVRVQGEVIPNELTGQVTTIFKENPEQPFNNAILHFNEGALAPIANPLSCGTATTTATFTAFTPGAPLRALGSPFTVDANGSGGACSSPMPFAPTQSTSNQVPTAGANTSFAFTLTRPEGSQYLKAISTTLPEGLLGLIPKVEQCGEAQANAGTCPAGSLLGSVTVLAGSGPTPYTFHGSAYLTGPYKGAPFGMSIVVPAVAGPFNLGLVVTRATITVDPYTARVTVSSEPPQIVHGGIVPRTREITVNVNRQGFLINPTNCSTLATNTTALGSLGWTGILTTPFQVQECNKLAFKPSFKSKSTAKASKANGASLETTLNLPAAGANVKSVVVKLPKQLPSRLTTLQKACPEATFAANFTTCPPGSFVGGVRANSPTLKDKLKGPAILVSHGGRAFPDLDLILEADGVRVIVVGNTDIKKGITTTSFATPPDAPVSSVTVNLPVGPHSALAAYGDLCLHPLLMPTVITGQNGLVTKQNTKITVTNCGVRVVGRKVVGNTVYLTVRTFAGGRVSGSGSWLANVSRRLRYASNAATLKVPLSRAGQRRGRPFSTRVRVGFVPNNRSLGSSVAYVNVTVR